MTWSSWSVAFSTLGGTCCGIALAGLLTDPKDLGRALGLVVTACVAFACAFALS